MMTKDYRHIDIRNNRVGQPRAYIRDSRLRVQDIVVDHQRFGHSAEQIAADYDGLSLAQVHSALAFYFDHREEIQAAIRDDEVFSDRMQTSGSAISVQWPLIMERNDTISNPVSP
ncbi:DUF433 domain-containing protein [Planctomycetes bacterium TBK1r]|uniref:DUF433 domain-containing protein n=1 Tax=Stieleria magnilauensis TaxID=2527963 RepID=A0ABX5XHB1_9BACT|nr:hypothetical protein TBK1r_02880 [Planctomycetes bacterium TBK1r]